LLKHWRAYKLLKVAAALKAPGFGDSSYKAIAFKILPVISGADRLISEEVGLEP